MVVSGEPASITCAPLTKLLPVTVIAIAPWVTGIGEIVVSTGTGFHSVTALCPAALESATMTACTETEFGLGSVAGAVYTPEALIVPVEAAPPVTPFTCQVTDVFEVPVTVALNGWARPARTVIGFGETETVTWGGGGGGEPGLPDDEPVTPAQSAWNRAAPSTKNRRIRRMMGTLALRRTIAQRAAENYCTEVQNRAGVEGSIDSAAGCWMPAEAAETI